MIARKVRSPSGASDPFASSLLGRPAWVRVAWALGGLAMFWIAVAWAVAVP